MPRDDVRYCVVLVGTIGHFMLCGLVAVQVLEQDGKRYHVCAFHARFYGRLPFGREALRK